MSLIADGLLIATCLTAALYCFVLSRRLKKLTSTEEGIGKQILQLNSALEETRTAVRDINGTAKSASERLAREVQNAKRSAYELQRLTEAAQQVISASKKGYDVPDEPLAATPTPETPSEPPTPADVKSFGGSQPLEDAPEPDEDLAGEDQLGFMPDAAAPAETEDASDLHEEPTTTADLADSAPGNVEQDAETMADRALLEESTGADDGETDPEPADPNLIRIERMAL